MSEIHTRHLTRRRFLQALAALGLAGAWRWRTGGYPGASALGLAELDGEEGAVLGAVLDALLPEGRGAVERQGDLRFLDGELAHLGPRARAELAALLWAVEQGGLAAGQLERFSRLERPAAQALLATWEQSPLALQRAGFSALKALAALAHYRRPEHWRSLGYAGPLLPDAARAAELRDRYEALRAAPRAGLQPGRIHGAAEMAACFAGRVRVDLETDVCVIGSGAGGGAAAWAAAESGCSVLVLEAGSFLSPRDMSQREEEMIRRLYWDMGGRTTSDKAVRVIQGRGVGGSTLHNQNLCKRLPAELRARWAEDLGIAGARAPAWDRLYAEAERDLGVSDIAADELNANNRLLEAGLARLGWRGGRLRHNRTGCARVGFCELGCAYDAKNNALKVYIRRALERGASVLADAAVEGLRLEGRRLAWVQAVARDPSSGRAVLRLRVRARRFVLSAGAIHTPALLLAAGVADPHRHIGRHLHLHPGTAAAGLMELPVRAWEGIPQGVECTEFLGFGADARRGRCWVLPASGHPVALAAQLPGLGAAHQAWMEQAEHLAIFAAMVDDVTAGHVRHVRGGAEIVYHLSRDDRRELVRGLAGAVRLLFAAGARQVILPTRPGVVLETPRDFERLDADRLAPSRIELVSVHPMGTCRMAAEARRGACDLDGRMHGYDNLYVADTSLYGSAIGVPPQLTAYALGLHVGRAVAGG